MRWFDVTWAGRVPPTPERGVPARAFFAPHPPALIGRARGCHLPKKRCGIGGNRSKLSPDVSASSLRPAFSLFFYSPPPAGPVLPALRPAQLTGGHPGASGGGPRTAGAEVTSLAPPPAPVCTRKASRRCGHTRLAPLCAPPRRQSRPPAPSPPSTPVGGWCPYCSPQTRRVHGARLSSASPPLSVHRPPGGVELTRVPPCGWGHVRRAVCGACFSLAEFSVVAPVWVVGGPIC